MLSFIARGDYRLMHRANNWLAPRWIQFWALGATRAGDGWLWGLMGLGVLFLGDQNRFATIGAGGLAAVSSVLAFMWLKRLTGRRRPCYIEHHCWATLLPPDQFSFPSGHTMTAFAMSVPVCMFYPLSAPAVIFFAISIAASRILLGMHFLSDVLVGVLIGSVLGFLSYLAFV